MGRTLKYFLSWGGNDSGFAFLGEPVKNPKDADIIVFTGGEDINPALYNEKKGKHTYFNKIRDLYEISLYNKFKDKSKLGVCRGHQLLTVLAGGSLIQHVSNHGNGNHGMILYTGEQLQVTSCHHQMAKLDALDKMEDYFLIGFTEGQSKTYLNGDDEETISTKYNSRLKNIVYKEPEMIYFPHNNAITVQFHPEWQNGSKVQDYVRDWCEMLVDNACDKFIGRNFKKTTIENAYEDVYYY